MDRSQRSPLAQPASRSVETARLLASAHAQAPGQPKRPRGSSDASALRHLDPQSAGVLTRRVERPALLFDWLLTGAAHGQRVLRSGVSTGEPMDGVLAGHKIPDGRPVVEVQFL